MKVLIVEDEIYNFNSLKKMILSEYPQVEIDGPVTNLIDLNCSMQNQSYYDIIYCDICLEDGICFSVFEQMEVTVPIIFTTAYSEFSLRAFDANGIGYLLKPIDSQKLRKATDKALSMKTDYSNMAVIVKNFLQNGSNSYLHYIRATTHNGIYIINLTDVSHFVVGERYTYALLTNGTKHRIDYTLDILMQRLNPIMFFRANRQYIVCRQAISLIENYGNRQVLLKLKGYDDVKILISKEKVPVLNRWIEQ